MLTRVGEKRFEVGASAGLRHERCNLNEIWAGAGHVYDFHTLSAILRLVRVRLQVLIITSR